MTALVIGGSGFLGQALVRRLVSEGHDVVATSRSTATRFALHGVRWRDFNLSQFSESFDLLDGVSLIYHLGWSNIPSTANSAPADDLIENVAGSVRLLEAVRNHAPQARFVFASSGGTVYGQTDPEPVREDLPLNPTGAYGLSKVTVERYVDYYVQNRGLDAVILRIGNPYGPGQMSARLFGAVTTFCAHALLGKPIVIFGNGSIVRDYLYVDDAVDALIQAGTTTNAHRHFNIGSGEGHSLKEIVDTVAEVLGHRPTVEYREARAFDLPVSVLDISRARSHLGWQPKTPFRDGLARTIEGLRQKAVP